MEYEEFQASQASQPFAFETQDDDDDTPQPFNFIDDHEEDGGGGGGADGPAAAGAAADDMMTCAVCDDGGGASAASVGAGAGDGLEFVEEDEREAPVPSELPAWACSYCNVHTPSAVVKCVTTGRWFCNYRPPGLPASCIVYHLIKSRNNEVTLHAESPLGEITLECFLTGTKNVFSLGFVPVKEDLVVLLARDVDVSGIEAASDSTLAPWCPAGGCTDASRTRPSQDASDWDLTKWQPLVREKEPRPSRRHVSSLSSAPLPPLLLPYTPLPPASRRPLSRGLSSSQPTRRRCAHAPARWRRSRGSRSCGGPTRPRPTPTLSAPKGTLSTAASRFPDTSWTLPRYFLDPSWTLSGHFLDPS